MLQYTLLLYIIIIIDLIISFVNYMSIARNNGVVGRIIRCCFEASGRNGVVSYHMIT